MHVVRGLRQTRPALRLRAGRSRGSGLWWALQGGGFRAKFGIALLVGAGLLALTGENALSRSGTLEINALMGMGPDRKDPSAGAGLTGVGIFLFVALPLFVIGGLLYGSG